MKSVGIVAKPGGVGITDVIKKLYSWLDKKGIQVFLESDTAEMVSRKEGYEKSEIAAKTDLIIVLGGDGTLLSLARHIRKTNVPILGVNMGNLGFLTVVSLENMCLAIENTLKGDYVIEKRITLDVSVMRDEKVTYQNGVINDAAINKGKIARIINLEIWINGQFATKYRSDGLIISTPTGSTAYSLSAGGPIVYPTMDALILSPICPHTLTNRPIIVPGDAVMEVLLTTESRNIILTLDGQEVFPIKFHDKIIVKKSMDTISLVQFPDKNHYQVLNKKLHWGK